MDWFDCCFGRRGIGFVLCWQKKEEKDRSLKGLISGAEGMTLSAPFLFAEDEGQEETSVLFDRK